MGVSFVRRVAVHGKPEQACSTSEFNPSPQRGGHLLQIWIVPDKRGCSHATPKKQGSQLPGGHLNLSRQNRRTDRSRSNQDADLYLAKLSAGDESPIACGPNRHAWVHVAEGEVPYGEPLRAGDGAALSEKCAEAGGKTPAQVLVFDLN